MFNLFSSIFVVNLKRSPERRQRIEKEMSNNHFFKGINFDFIEAVDGQTITLENEPLLKEVKIVEKWKEPYMGRHITKGEVGCALSHYKIWKKMVDESIDNVLVLEDDIEFLEVKCNSDNLDNLTIIDDNKKYYYTSLLDSVEKEIKENNLSYDLFYLGRRVLSSSTEEKVSQHICKPKYSYCTHSYVITLQGAKKLVNSGYLQHLIPLDEFLSILFDPESFRNNNQNKKDMIEVLDLYENFPKLVCYSTVPNIFEQTGGNLYKSNTYHSDSFINDSKETDYIILSVATDEREALDRFTESCKTYDQPYKILGLGRKWNGGDLEKGPGGGQKINFLKEELDSWSEEKLNKTTVLFSDSYDVIVNANKQEVLEKYSKFGKSILFSGEMSCWPIKTLEDFYPKTESKYRFLNSGGFIGNAKNILDIISIRKIEDYEDDQLYFTKCFLSSNYDIKIDYSCEIFQTLNGAKNDMEILFNRSRIRNIHTNTIPCIFHGNGPESVKLYLDKLGNYLGNGWNSTYKYCNKLTFDVNNLPTIFVNLNDSVKENILEQFDKFCDNMTVYVSKYKDETELETEFVKSVNLFLKTDCKYYLYIDKNINVTNGERMIYDMLESGKSVVSPMFVKNDGGIFSNFWGELSSSGFYARSFDYIDIVKRIKKAVWNVPYISNIYLIRRDILEKYKDIQTNVDIKLDLDMRLSYNLRKNKIFMHTVNLNEYGYIKNEDEGDKDNNITIYDLFKKQTEWEKKYLHPEFMNFRNNQTNIFEEICGDAFSFPIFTQNFCKELINECDKLGSWSPGKDNHIDNRLGKNAYENFPTQDIHLNQIGFEKQWEFLVMNYIAPIASFLYSKYKTKGTNISFVVKYSMDGQQFLSPHHDASAYTVNIALNEEYEGGGCRFIRQNVSLLKQKTGYSSIHPGRLTHYHEGLPITSGKRYILVSFIN